METILLENRYAKVYAFSEYPQVFVCELLVEYVPEQNFKELFGSIAAFIDNASTTITKLIFNKSRLRTFHQPSMTWYHLEWKPERLKKGLHTYRKILPNDNFFRKSVEIGRNKIAQDHPEFDWAKYDIQYCDSVQEALAL